MLRATISNLRAHLRRLISTGFSVVLGVGFLAATLFIGDSLRSSFDEQFQSANQGLAVEVSSTVEFGSDDIARQSGSVDLSLVPAVESVNGVRRVAASFEGVGQIVDADGNPMGGDGPPTLAGNWIDDDDLNPYRIAEGRAPAAEGEVVIDRRSAEAGDLEIGSTTTVLTPAPVQVDVVGIATFGDQDSFGPVSWVAFDDDQAHALFAAGDGRASTLRIAADDGVDDATLAASIELVLPDDLVARTGAEVAADQLAAVEGDFIGFFEGMLLAFAGIALLVSTFSIHNTFSILVAQRSRESALLRALGASRLQVLSAVTVEALAVGVVASGIGLVAGVGLAQLAFAAMDAAGFGVGGGLVVEVGAVLTAFLVGTAVTLVASLAPSIAASRVAPVAAMRETAAEPPKASTMRVVAGLVLLVIGGVALVSAPGAGSGAMARAALGGAGLLVATVVLGPFIAKPVASALGAPVQWLRGPTGVLARRNAVRNPRRTSGTASALTIGVAVVALFTVFAASVTKMLDDTVTRSFGGDLVIQSAGFSGPGLSADLGADVDALPEVERAVGIGNGVLQVDGETWYASVTDAPRLDGLLQLDVVEGSLADVGAGTLALSATFAEEEALALGDAVEATLGDGSEALVVTAIFDSSQLLGDVILPTSVWSAHTAQVSDVAVLVEGADGVSLDALDRAVTEVTGAYSAPDPMTRDEYVDAAAGEIDQILGVIYGLLAVAVLIALMGIANTISLSVHERTREIGLLRAVGQSRAQLRSMIRWESVVVSTFGTTLGIALGVLVGWGLLRAMSEVEGVATPLAVPVAPLLVVVAIGAAAGVVAAWRPARRAARMDVLVAIATD